MTKQELINKPIWYKAGTMLNYKENSSLKLSHDYEEIKMGVLHLIRDLTLIKVAK